RARPLLDKFLPHQMAKNPVQALFGNLKDAEQFAYRHLRMTPDEMNDAMMGAAETKFGQDGVGLCGEITIGEEQQLYPLAQSVLGQKDRLGRRFYVSHIDLSRNV